MVGILENNNSGDVRHIGAFKCKINLVKEGRGRKEP